MFYINEDDEISHYHTVMRLSESMGNIFHRFYS